MRAAPILSDFTRGLLTERMNGRIDHPYYYRGCKKLSNMFVYPEGPVSKMPGTYYISGAKDDSKKSRMVGFSPGEGYFYSLEFADGKIRVYRNGEQIQSGAAPVEITVPYAEADLFALKFQPVGVDLYIVHGSHDPRKLTWGGDTSWTLTTPSWTGQTFTGAGNRPTSVAFYEGRLIFCRGNKIFGSKTFTYTNFTVGTTAADGFEFEISSKRNPFIRWVEAKNEILIGAVGGEYRMSGGGAAMTPSNVFAREQTTFGSANIQGKLVKDVLFFVNRNAKTVLEYYWFDEQGAYKSANLSLQTDMSIFDGGIVEFTVQQSPFDMVWFVTGNGKLIGLTYEREYDVLAWHVHETDGEYESVSCVPGDDEDMIYVSVKRTINGTTKRFIEYFSPFLWEEHEDAYHVHCGLTYDGGDAADITSVTTGTETMITCASGDLPSDGDYVRIKDCGKIPALQNHVYEVSDASGTTFKIKDENGTAYIDSSSYAVFSDGSYGTFEQVKKTITGLDHLNGESVVALADGNALTEMTVDSGNATMPIFANKAHLGLSYRAVMAPMDIVPVQSGNRRKGRIFRVQTKFYKTADAEIGVTEGSLTTIIFRTGSFEHDAPPPLTTGWKETHISSDYADELPLVYVSDTPQPMTIQSIMPEIEVNRG